MLGASCRMDGWVTAGEDGTAPASPPAPTHTQCPGRPQTGAWALPQGRRHADPQASGSPGPAGPVPSWQTGRSSSAVCEGRRGGGHHTGSPQAWDLGARWASLQKGSREPQTFHPPTKEQHSQADVRGVTPHPRSPRRKTRQNCHEQGSPVTVTLCLNVPVTRTPGAFLQRQGCAWRPAPAQCVATPVAAAAHGDEDPDHPHPLPG